METVIEILSGPLSQSLLRALLHSLWVGAILVAFVIVFLSCAPVSKTSGRYAVALGAQCLLPLLTCFLWGLFQNGAEKVSGSSKPIEASVVGTPDLSPAAADVLSQLQESSPVIQDAEIQEPPMWTASILSAWILGASFFLGILLRDAYRVRRLGRQQIGAAVAAQLEPIISDFSRRLGIQNAVSIFEAEVTHPAVSGVIQPVVFLPRAFLKTAAPKVLRAVLAHELAHIRRYDYLINVVQRILESLLFFNPAMWLLGSFVRSEREACCDAVASDLVGDKLAYVEGVTEWATRSADVSSQALLPAIRGSGDSKIVDRLRRVLFPSRRSRVSVRVSTVLVSLAVIAVAMFVIQKSSQKVAGLLTNEERIVVSKELRTGVIDPLVRSEPYEIRVTVEHLDGQKPTPEELKNVSLTIENWSSRTNSVIGASLSGDAVYRRQLEGGIVRVKMSSEKWAPFISPFQYPEAGSNTLDVVVKLDPGEPAWFVLQDSEGNAAGGVNVSYLLDGGNGSWLRRTSDAAGRILQPLGGREKYRMQIRDPNYAWLDLESVSLSPGETVPISLRDPIPLSLVFKKQSTGEPITGELRIATQFGYQGNYEIARTDEQGRAKISILGAGDARDLCFLSDAGHRLFLPQMMAAEPERHFLLPEPITVSGWIQLDERSAENSKATKSYEIQIDGSASWNPRASYGWRQTATTNRIEQGKAYFSFTGVWPGSLTLRSGAYRADLEISDQSVSDVVLSLQPKEEPIPRGERKRDFLFRFVSPEKSPPFSGTVRYSYLAQEDGNGLRTQWKSGLVENGVLEIRNLPIHPAFSLVLEADGLDGFWFPPVRLSYQERKEWPSAGQPIETEVVLLPAGGIRGEVFEADGSPASGISISVRHWNEPGREKYDLAPVKNSSTKADGIYEFFASPLPLGESYRLVVHRSDTYLISDPIQLTNAKPFQNTTLHFKEGVTITGMVTNEEGVPAAGAPVRLTFEMEGIGGFGNEGTVTNPDGEFSFPNVDFTNGGTYEIEVGHPRESRVTRVEVSPNQYQNVRIVSPDRDRNLDDK